MNEGDLLPFMESGEKDIANYFIIFVNKYKEM